MILRLSGKRYDHLRRCLHGSKIFENPYRVLGIKAGATKKEIKSAYRDLVKTCHPDLFPDDKSKEAEFRRIQEAYENILSGNITSSDPSAERSSGTRSSRSPFGEYKEGPLGDWGFEQNYRARMRARAEWEKMAKEYKDAEREKYQKANRHHANWDEGRYANEDGTQWHKEQAHESYTSHRAQSHRARASSYGRDFRSDDDYKRFQAARRVQQNLHKSDKYRRHFDDEEIEKMNEAAFRRRHKYYQAAAAKEKEDNAWRTESPNQKMAKIAAQICSIGIIYSFYYIYKESKEARELEITKKQAYLANSNESVLRFNQMVQERLADNASRARMTHSDDSSTSKLSAADRQILDTLEHNSAVLKSNSGSLSGPLR